ncbi:MAG: hypothetical protein HQ592_10215 [Planctomycetes bacterium]|nr:hypothetical protein [Planctomycetota bacterium]
MTHDDNIVINRIDQNGPGYVSVDSTGGSITVAAGGSGIDASGVFNLTEAELQFLDSTGTVTIGVNGGTGLLTAGSEGKIDLTGENYDHALFGGDLALTSCIILADGKQLTFNGNPISGGPGGDANGDFSVNMLDIIDVRNCLHQNPASDDNWRADVNDDGAINILDMLFVRNRLNTTCD